MKRLLEKKPKTRQDIQLIKLEVAREEKFDSIPPNNQLLAEINAKEEPELAKLRVKPMRTSAGVTPVAIMTIQHHVHTELVHFVQAGLKMIVLNLTLGTNQLQKR